MIKESQDFYNLKFRMPDAAIGIAGRRQRWRLHILGISKIFPMCQISIIFLDQKDPDLRGISTGPGRFGSKPPWAKWNVQIHDEASSNSMCYVGLVVDLVHA